MYNGRVSGLYSEKTLNMCNKSIGASFIRLASSRGYHGHQEDHAAGRQGHHHRQDRQGPQGQERQEGHQEGQVAPLLRSENNLMPRTIRGPPV